MNYFRKSEKGFTLTELMICVAIISILASIATPNFMSYRSKGYDVVALSSARNFYTAAIAEPMGSDDIYYTFVNSILPGGYRGLSINSGAFVYTAATGSIRCDASFKHDSGATTYTLNDTGTIQVTHP